MSPAHRHLSERQVAATLLPRGGGGRAASADRLEPAACPQCAAQLDEAARLAREFHGHVLPRTLPCIHERAAAAAGRPGAQPGAQPGTRMSACWQRRSSGPRARRRWWLGAPVAAAALAAAVLAVRPRLPGRGEPGAGLGSDVGSAVWDEAGNQAGLLPKGAGDAPARLFVRRGHGARRLDDGATVHPGDVLAFAVDSARARYALVLSIDGARRISIYSPYEGARSGPVPLGVLPVVLEPSIILDGTLGPERIWLLLSDEPIAVGSLRPALDRLAAAGPAAVAAAHGDDLLAAVPDLAGDAGSRARVVSWLLHKVAP